MDVEFLKHQFEDGFYGVIAKQAFRIGVRHLQMVYMLVGSVMMGMVRGSVGVAVLAMVEPQHQSDTYVKIHNWDKTIQGAIVSSFFFGYAIMIVPADKFLRKIGGKIGFTAMTIVTGALCVAMPTIANKGGWVSICNANLLMGMAQGCFAAVYQTLLEEWLPPCEKKLFSSIIFGGLHVGIMLAFPFTFILSGMKLSWELIYYALAMLIISMSIVVFTLTASNPEKHQAIGDQELEYIRESLSYYRKKVIRKPWRDMLRSPPLWGAISAHIASNVLFVFFIVGMPAYIASSANNLKGGHAFLPLVSMWVIYLLSAPIIDWIYKYVLRDKIHSTIFRKFINAIGSCCVTAGLIWLSNTQAGLQDFSLVSISTLLGFVGIQYSGFLADFNNISENYAGTLMTISSAVSSLIGSAVPMVMNLVLESNSDIKQKWRIIFISISTVYTVCNLIYTVFGSSERQDWDHLGLKRKLKGYVRGSPVHTNLIQLEEIVQMKIIPEICETHTSI